MSYDPAARRAYHLPESIARTEAKLARLYAEHRGRDDYKLAHTDFFHAAWEAAILEAKLEARKNGQEFSMGVDRCL